MSEMDIAKKRLLDALQDADAAIVECADDPRISELFRTRAVEYMVRAVALNLFPLYGVQAMPVQIRRAADRVREILAGGG